jgi:hypothetical protein
MVIILVGIRNKIKANKEVKAIVNFYVFVIVRNNHRKLYKEMFQI